MKKKQKDNFLSGGIIEENLFNIYKNFDNQELPEEIYLLPLRLGVMFPAVISPVQMLRQISKKLIRQQQNKDGLVGVVTQKKPDIDFPGPEDLYSYGTLAFIVNLLEVPGMPQAVILTGLKKFKIKEITQTKPFLKAKIEYHEDYLNEEEKEEFAATIKKIRKITEDIWHSFDEIENVTNFKNFLENDEIYMNFVIQNLSIEVEKKIKLLTENSLKKRADLLMELLGHEIEKEKIKQDIQKKVNENINEQQREFLLRQQLRAIQQELGDEPGKDEIENLKQKARKKNWPEKVRKIFEKELSRLARLHPASPEYGMQINYLQTLLDLPWNEKTKDIYDLKKAKEILDKDHFGLEKVKERILEYLAVLKLKKGNLKSPIICLYGPPGVGKTSLGQSVAKALNRKYIRMSLGGLRDEAEIRGHRRTYIGSMPGRIIQSLKRAKSSNPVFVLDEIDKIGHDFRGDPASALLEVLDPEQNHSFYDNYLEVEYDLSDVLFIATANTLSSIHPALRDRMEIIEMTGYIVEEKIEIAKKHLLPKQLKAHGLRKNQIKFSDEVLKFLIENYTRESGVRELDKKLAAIIRKTAKKIAFGEKRKAKLTEQDIKEFLGYPKFSKSVYEKPDVAGVVPGLAWTPVGGELLMIEASISRGNGKLTLTGNLGDIMKESAIIALEYTKSHYQKLKIHPLVFKYWNVHLHVPHGAIPKDGPSAGITMATALASVFTQKEIKPFTAMTGELTLSGKILPVGGIKEKILAAKRAGIKEIILSKKNKNEVNEIKNIYTKDIIFHFVKNMNQVYDIILTEKKVQNPMNVGIPKSALKKNK